MLIEYPEVHVRFRFDMRLAWFAGKKPADADNIAAAAMTCRMEGAVLFHNRQAGPFLDNIGCIFNGSLHQKTFAGLHKSVGQLPEERIVAGRSEKLQQLGRTVACSFLPCNHSEEIALYA
ncbi:MAG: hypothetical protein ACD_75C00304G0001 [uncultured bacterium]|nr:MAG: hypothetical protein ACD_75C00304G0001 [uncultured bacterium]